MAHGFLLQGVPGPPPAADNRADEALLVAGEGPFHRMARVTQEHYDEGGPAAAAEMAAWFKPAAYNYGAYGGGGGGAIKKMAGVAQQLQPPHYLEQVEARVSAPGWMGPRDSLEGYAFAAPGARAVGEVAKRAMAESPSPVIRRLARRSHGPWGSRGPSWDEVGEFIMLVRTMHERLHMTVMGGGPVSMVYKAGSAELVEVAKGETLRLLGAWTAANDDMFNIAFIVILSALERGLIQCSEAEMSPLMRARFVIVKDDLRDNRELARSGEDMVKRGAVICKAAQREVMESANAMAVQVANNRQLMDVMVQAAGSRMPPPPRYGAQPGPSRIKMEPGMNVQPMGPGPPQLCRLFAMGKCSFNPCRFMHAMPPPQ